MKDFIPHLIELRLRLLRFITVFIVLFLCLFLWDETLFSFFIKPLFNNSPWVQLIATEITTPFTIPMKLAFFVALFLAAPHALFEIWRFVAPGLYPHERRIWLPLFCASLGLFYVGACFAYVCICPVALRYFIGIAPDGVLVSPEIRNTLDFVLTLILGGGIGFQVPILTVLLIHTNILSAERLAYLRPYVIVLAFVLGMLLTPPDVVSQILLAIPMWGMFEVGLWVGKIMTKNDSSNNCATGSVHEQGVNGY